MAKMGTNTEPVQAEDQPGQCGQGDDKGADGRPPQADGVFRTEGRAPEDGVQHPPALPQDGGGADAGGPEEEGQGGGIGVGVEPPEEEQINEVPKAIVALIRPKRLNMFQIKPEIHQSRHQQQGQEVADKGDGH